MSGGFELGEGFRATPLEPVSPVRHEVLIVTPGVSPIEHAGLVVVSEAADVAVPIMIHDGVVMDLVAGGRVSTERARTSVLLNQDDTVTASGHLDPVAIDLHVLGILDIDLGAPTPSARVTVPIPDERVVADDRVVTDLVADAIDRVMDDNIVLVERVDVVDVGPHARTIIVVRVVASHDQVICVSEFESARFPKRINARPEAVRCELVALNEDVIAVPAEPHLAIVMHVIADDLAAVMGSDAHGVIQADFIVPNGPTLVPANGTVLDHEGHTSR